MDSQDIAEKHKSQWNRPSTQSNDIPSPLRVLPLRNTVAFPHTVLPLSIGVPRSVRLVEEIFRGDRMIGLFTARDPAADPPKPGQIHEVGTLARIERLMRPKDKSLQVLVQCQDPIRVRRWTEADEPYIAAEVERIPEPVPEDVEIDALKRSLRDLAHEVIALSPNYPKEAADILNRVTDPRFLVYMVASNANLELHRAQELLETDDLKEKLRTMIVHLSHEREVLSLGKKIQSDAKEEMDKAQREFFLRQQLKAIQKELGETEEGVSEADEYADAIETLHLPDEARKEALRELKRFRSMSPHAPEYSIIKTYLDWIVELPWTETSEDQMDIDRARRVLDEDHYDLQDVKERIIEYLAVRKLVAERGAIEPDKDLPGGPEAMGAILCFAGPPGVGKTSLGQSIARALGRQFTRMSLGGMRDEAEIRGHRRTYIGAMPGRIIQAIKRAGTRNPVFMLDEVDKVGSDWRGDPSSALLEVLDPAQNRAFRDHYLDVDFDLSDVMFITTANQRGTIPAPLLDRMEIISLDGYTELEKLKIAEGHLVPRQIRANGLWTDEVTFTETALKKIIEDYTREAGVRNLERQIGAICRKSAVRIVGHELARSEITPELVRTYLKKEQFESDLSEQIEIPGIATGLAVTATGGDILFIEATRMRGKGGLTLTGQLGEVMRESAQIAHSYVRAKAAELHVDPDGFEKTDVHLHVPAGAIPKDGPSAGVAMVMAMASLFSGKPVRGDTGMTGEVTLRGRVLPVGGIKMKVLAAHRAGLATVILPRRNEKDLDDIPDEVREAIEIVFVDRIDEALDRAFRSETEPDVSMAANG